MKNKITSKNVTNNSNNVSPFPMNIKNTSIQFYQAIINSLDKLTCPSFIISFSISTNIFSIKNINQLFLFKLQNIHSNKFTFFITLEAEIDIISHPPFLFELNEYIHVVYCDHLYFYHIILQNNSIQKINKKLLCKEDEIIVEFIDLFDSSVLILTSKGNILKAEFSDDSDYKIIKVFSFFKFPSNQLIQFSGKEKKSNFGKNTCYKMTPFKLNETDQLFVFIGVTFLILQKNKNEEFFKAISSFDVRNILIKSNLTNSPNSEIKDFQLLDLISTPHSNEISHIFAVYVILFQNSQSLKKSVVFFDKISIHKNNSQVLNSLTIFSSNESLINNVQVKCIDCPENIFISLISLISENDDFKSIVIKVNKATFQSNYRNFENPILGFDFFSVFPFENVLISFQDKITTWEKFQITNFNQTINTSQSFKNKTFFIDPHSNISNFQNKLGIDFSSELTVDLNDQSRFKNLNAFQITELMREIYSRKIISPSLKNSLSGNFSQDLSNNFEKNFLPTKSIINSPKDSFFDIILDQLKIKGSEINNLFETTKITHPENTSFIKICAFELKILLKILRIIRNFQIKKGQKIKRREFFDLFFHKISSDSNLGNLKYIQNIFYTKKDAGSLFLEFIRIYLNEFSHEKELIIDLKDLCVNILHKFRDLKLKYENEFQKELNTVLLTHEILANLVLFYDEITKSYFQKSSLLNFNEIEIFARSLLIEISESEIKPKIQAKFFRKYSKKLFDSIKTSISPLEAFRLAYK